GTAGAGRFENQLALEVQPLVVGTDIGQSDRVGLPMLVQDGDLPIAQLHDFLDRVSLQDVAAEVDIAEYGRVALEAAGIADGLVFGRHVQLLHFSSPMPSQRFSASCALCDSGAPPS